ncbi:hypothetical protein [Streptomyces sp. LMG1-1-1.1]|uniref:hypothetical protein n=1 Tax=Streptomyces sp. LMG1-1-1.1 TaxID=3135245 RepID=UPI00346606B5
MREDDLRPARPQLRIAGVTVIAAAVTLLGGGAYAVITSLGHGSASLRVSDVEGTWTDTSDASARLVVRSLSSTRRAHSCPET